MEDVASIHGPAALCYKTLPLFRPLSLIYGSAPGAGAAVSRDSSGFTFQADDGLPRPNGFHRDKRQFTDGCRWHRVACIRYSLVFPFSLPLPADGIYSFAQFPFLERKASLLDFQRFDDASNHPISRKNRLAAASMELTLAGLYFSSDAPYTVAVSWLQLPSHEKNASTSRRYFSMVASCFRHSTSLA